MSCGRKRKCNMPTLLLLICTVNFCRHVFGARVELEGPSLVLQPEPLTYFSNSVGTTLSCLGKGSPPISVTWLSVNGDVLPQIPELRERLPNGSLYFGPIRSEELNQEIHSSQVQCALSNPVGTFLSPLFTVRAVLDTPFELFITGSEESDIVEGTPVVLQCNISPPSYLDFVQVITWKSVDQFGYQSEVKSDGIRYQITSRGSLIIFSAKYQQQLFVCVAQNKLNKKTQSSLPFLVKSSQAGSGSIGLPPKTSSRWEQAIQAELGKSLDLICSAAGNPPLHFRWEKWIPNSNARLPVQPSLGLTVYGPVISFSRIDISHNGSYRCEITNSFGSIVLDYHVQISSKPVLTMEPRRRLMLRNGQSAELTCRLSMSPLSSDGVGAEPSGSKDITWYKNGKIIFSQGNRIKVTSNKLLLINSQLEDQGVYQCFVHIESLSIQASAELVFEASAPELHQTFISQSLQPGPTVSLKCSASGNPVPELSWSVDGQELVPTWPARDDPVEARYWQISDRYSVGSYRQFTETVSHVNISGVRVEDGGAYQCTASNLLGRLSHSARLNVYGPLFVKEMPSLTLVAEEVALIPCLYGGYPVDKISWEKTGGTGKGAGNSGGRLQTLANGTLRIDKINTEGDKGQYTCYISNRKGESASGLVDVNVMHPPVISEFNFDPHLVEGQRTSVTCNVISGDLPIDIKWLKDYQLIPAFLNITEMRVKFLSYLIFEELDREHSGVYTCSVSNAASTANHSATLSVKVPPYWLIEPQDAKVILRTSHLIPCQAGGVPKPIIKWFRETGMMKLPVQTDRKFEVVEDGSLRMEEVEAMDGSNYTCEAQNGVGTGLEKSIRLHVNIPAKVSAPMTSVVVAEGLPTLLKCQIRGDEPIEVEWRKNSIVLSETGPRVVTDAVLDTNSSLLLAQLRIDRTERSDSGLFLCSASNQYGRDEDRISLEVKARPPAPEDFIVEEIGSRFIRLRWSHGPQTTSTAPVTYFVLQFKKSSSLSWVNDVYNMTVQSPATHAVLEPLNPVTNYDIRILASNEIGHSLPTEPLAVLTLPEAPSGPPLNISALPISSKSVLVRWDAPNPSLQHGSILGYHVFASLQSSNQAGANNTVVVDEKWSQQTELGALRPNSQYRISIRAYNSVGMGPESPFVHVHTPEGVPDSPPLNVRCEGLSSRSLQVEWEPPPAHFCNGQIQGYKVIYQSLQDEKYGEKPEVKKTSNRETTLHGLQSFTNYSIRTLAYTVGGEGVLSEPLYCLTDEDVPEEPADLKVLSTSSTSALVSWLSPRHPNGIMTKYTIYWRAEDAEAVKEKSVVPSPWDEEQVTFEVRRLRENHKYTFWVTATTGAGTGKPSKLQTVLLSSKVSSRIASFPVTRHTVLDQPVLLPCKTIGVPPPKVSWLRKNRLETSHHLLRNNSLFITRVKDQDEGIWTCRAENLHYTDEIQHQIFIARPPSVVPLFLGYVSSTSVQIHWEGPQRPDPPVTGYVLHYKREIGSTPSSIPKSGSSEEGWEVLKLNSRSTSYTLERIRCGSVYVFSLAAENVIGLGEFSSMLRTRTNGNPPDGNPALNEILDGNGTMLQIDLSRWPDGGCPLISSSFQIEYKPKEAPNWQRIYRRDNTTRQFTFNSMPKVVYEIRITVENDAGSVVKLFEVESDSEFFANYEKVQKEKGRVAEERSSGVSFLMDPHVVVPIVSAVICTCALGLCLVIVLRRRASAKEEWKFAHSTSQQTWLSSEVDGQPGAGKLEAVSNRAGGNMSIYATLNSSKAIPMEIRDSTVRFQTFGQRDNYDAAPPIPAPNFKRNRRKSAPSASPPDEAPCIQIPNQKDFGGQVESRGYRYYDHQSDSDDTEDSLYPNYARPYQLTAYRRGGANDMVPPDKRAADGGGGRNTLKKKQAARSRASSREYLE